MENKLTSIGFASSEITTGINGSVIEEDAIDGALEATAMEDGSGSLGSNVVLKEITTKQGDGNETLCVIVAEISDNQGLGEAGNRGHDEAAIIAEI